MNSVVRKATADVLITWSQPDNGGSPLTGYRVSRKTGAAGTYAVIATVTNGCPACKTSYDDTTATDTTAQYFYKVTALNAVGESASCGEFGIAALGPIESPCVAPGITLLTDPAADNVPPVPGTDLLALHLAQPLPRGRHRATRVYDQHRPGASDSTGRLLVVCGDADRHRFQSRSDDLCRRNADVRILHPGA